MRSFFALITLLFLTACTLDKHYQDDVNFPASARVVNTGEWVEITRIVGDPDGDILYSLKGNSLGNGESYTLETTWDVAKSLKNGDFFIQGKCQGGTDWEKRAGEVATSVSPSEEDDGLIIIEILACP